MVCGQRAGATLRRSGFIRLQEAIFAGTVKMVIVWKLDRIARSMREGINILSGWWECGVRVVSVTQQIDLSGTVGHLVAGVLFAVAEIELDIQRPQIRYNQGGPSEGKGIAPERHEATGDRPGARRR
jgi:DNA invertase Pin-like site-specific DNA recombinase